MSDNFLYYIKEKATGRFVHNISWIGAVYCTKKGRPYHTKNAMLKDAARAQNSIPTFFDNYELQVIPLNPSELVTKQELQEAVGRLSRHEAIGKLSEKISKHIETNLHEFLKSVLTRRWDWDSTTAFKRFYSTEKTQEFLYAVVCADASNEARYDSYKSHRIKIREKLKETAIKRTDYKIVDIWDSALQIVMFKKEQDANLFVLTYGGKTFKISLKEYENEIKAIFN